MSKWFSRAAAGVLAGILVISSQGLYVTAQEAVQTVKTITVGEDQKVVSIEDGGQLPLAPEGESGSENSGENEGDKSQPEDGSKPEGGDQPGSESQPEGGNQPEDGSKPEGEDQPEDGSKPEGGNQPESGSKSEGGDQPAGESQPGDGTSQSGSGEENPEGSGDSQTQEPKTTVEGEDKSGNPEGESGAKSTMSGSVEVLITAGVRIESPREFHVSLKGVQEHSGTALLPGSKEEDKEAARVSVLFSDLQAGTYTLTVTAAGFVAYTQTIQVENLGYRVQLYTGAVAGNFTDQSHPGLLRLGDVNGDGSLNQSDADLLVDAIEKGEVQATYDLNGDGTVDLLDLNLLTRNMELKEAQSTLEKLISPGAAEQSLQTGIVTEGSLLDLQLGAGSVTMAPAGEGEVSENNPIVINFDFTRVHTAPMEGIVIQSPEENSMAGGRVLVAYVENGVEKAEFVRIPEPDGAGLQMVSEWKENTGFKASWKDGALCIDLGGQIAVKAVTLEITKAVSKLNLVEISRVEFLNDMESRIPDPVMNIPQILSITPGNKSFVLEWTREPNVTAYQVRITSNGQTEYRRTTATTLAVRQFGGDKLTNNTPYEISIQSLNGEWKSGFGEVRTVTPKPDGVPPAPDRVSVTGAYRSIQVRWSSMKDTDSYNLYYREAGTGTYEKIEGLTGLYHVVEGLKDDTKYEVYLTGSNELGEGPASLTQADKTLSGLIAAKLPAYKLINTSNGEGVLSAHIQSVTVRGAEMVDSPLDQGSSGLGLFDNSYTSFLTREDWDYGAAYPADEKSVLTELDDVYEIGMITLAEPMDYGSYGTVYIQYWDESGQRQTAKNVTIQQRSDGTRKYFLIKFKDPIRTSKIQMGIGRHTGYLRKITIAEIRFHEYDSLENDILGLYADDLCITLKDSVTLRTIEDLQVRLDTKDPVSGEYHPERAALQKELDAARQLLETEGLGGVIQVNPDITAAKDRKIQVGGLTSRQPLGVTAAAEEQLVVYVGNPGMTTGAKTGLKLVFTQQHAESNGLAKTADLVIGRNEITVPKFSSTDVEKGGALYVQYGGTGSDHYAVRVSGGQKIPVLNVYGVYGAERTQRIQQYVTELEDYVSELTAQHGAVHSGSGNEHVNYGYDPKTCILNTTDIVMDQMMISIPASQALAGLGSGDRAAALANGIRSMDEMMKLFYQHKGLTDSFPEGTSAEVVESNHLPYQYLNIRYMKMFAGAFMYAAGDHVGIEWDSTTITGRTPASFDQQGLWNSGQYFGWGIAHEIGHEINQGAYSHAEVTNNYFSVLAQARDTNDSVRFQYPQVFKKVTSGSEGYADNVFTQLGLYWQLHLAYDSGYNYKTYDSYQEIFDNLFFARVDSYARVPETAPAPGGVSLELPGDRDQNLMRLASAAAGKDLTEFFTRWGMTPNDGTKAYMNQFPKEERAIYYQDDNSRSWRLQGGSGSYAGKSVVTARAEEKDGVVTLTLSCTGEADSLHGYEITRVLISQGEEYREIAGFTQESSFRDEAASASNRVVRYEVTAIDKFMNRSEPCETQAVKIQGDGLQEQKGWTVSTNAVSDQDQIQQGSDDTSCTDTVISAVSRVIDNDTATTFTGTTESGDASVVLELHKFTQVTGLRYTYTGTGQSIGNYRIEVSADGQTYTEVKAGTFALKDGSAMVYFTNGKDEWVCTYDAAYVRLTAVGQQSISISELDLFGPSGDNVELLSAEDGTSGIGLLASDYVYDTGTGEKIPKGSLMFTGEYKGNPAYNVVILYDDKGNIVGGTSDGGTLKAKQIILAPNPGNAMLGEVSSGIWIYWIDPAEIPATLPGRVRAELYRVDNALTNAGQRLVSDTWFVEVPEKGSLPQISLSGAGAGR